ncbi:hypothetical protein [Wenyingzhuangia aestuarii]|uniref:hypothetical protein n=1 Tax=Wenyingzhuangia aestuarii TaxID=1647582 RepID=UPI00143A2E05|nr:hypothetical protein [Wenyingzhuangia aestuarii]NJB83623.1 endonuclease III [Wenyingzhuangia aestuarii]
MLETFLYPVIASFLTALTTWGFAKGKTKQQIRALQIENDEKSAKYYQGLVDDLAKRLEKAIEEIGFLDKERKELIDINRQLIDELRKYKQLRKEKIE